MGLAGSFYKTDALAFLATLASESIDMFYMDPPFNTGDTQQIHGVAYEDSFDDYEKFLKPIMSAVCRALKPSGSFYLHLDWRESAYAKVWGDSVFGRANYANEIIWAFDYGARQKKVWPRKHNTIHLWAKNIDRMYYNTDEVDRIPYMTPALVGPDKAAAGKTPTDVWWLSIVGTNSHERLGYPTQKPEKLLSRCVLASSPLGGLVVDPTCGSGTLGAVALATGRKFKINDISPQAHEIMAKRFGAAYELSGS